MPVIDWVGAVSARMTGIAALVPAWLLFDRYTLGYLTGGPVVIAADGLRSTLYPLFWFALAWILLSTRSTRHLLFRRKLAAWRFLLGVLYAGVVPMIFLFAIEGISANWLENPWIGDVFMIALPIAWISFLAAFSLPGGYARNIAKERDAAYEVSRYQSEESRSRKADRAYAAGLREAGLSDRARLEEDDPLLTRWEQRMEERHAYQTEVRDLRRAESRARDRRAFKIQLAVGAAVLSVIALAIMNMDLTLGQNQWLQRYMPVVISVVAILAFVLGNFGWGVRGGTTFGRVFRIVGFVTIVSVLANFVFFPAGTNVLAILYHDLFSPIAGALLQIASLGQ